MHTHTFYCYVTTMLIYFFATPWTLALQAPASVGFFRQQYWSGLPFPSPGDLLNPGIKPMSLTPPAMASQFFTITVTWGAHITTMCVLVAQLCTTLCNPIDCSPPGPSVHGILQARTLEQVAISFSKRNYRKKESEVAQSCPTLCDPMDCSLPSSSIHAVSQARVQAGCHFLPQYNNYTILL